MISFNEFKKYLLDDKKNSLELLAQKSLLETQKRFGKTIELYAPLYISNFCQSVCTYCNFTLKNKKIIRKNLSMADAEREMTALKNAGIDDILLLTGELDHPRRTGFVLDYVKLASRYFTKIGLEIFSCATSEYDLFQKEGVTYVTIYQETYDKAIYEKAHKAGQKKNYEYRRQTPRRILESSIKGIGMGVLFGLARPEEEALALAEHICSLRKKYWHKDFSISFPRIRDRRVKYPVTDRFLARVIFLFRLLFPDVTLVLSTRESSTFRNGIAGIGINKMSAGSKTTVGGYADKVVGDKNHQKTDESKDPGQFEVEDKRSIEDIALTLNQKGFTPVKKNHDRVYT